MGNKGAFVRLPFDMKPEYVQFTAVVRDSGVVGQSSHVSGLLACLLCSISRILLSSACSMLGTSCRCLVCKGGRDIALLPFTNHNASTTRIQFD
jgi:hypothetical protein